MIQFVWNVLATLPLVVMLLGVAAIRSKREMRVAQLGTAAFSVLFLIAALIVLYRFNSSVSDVVGSLAGWGPLSWVRGWNGFSYLAQNVLVIAVFLLIKLVLLKLLEWSVRRWSESIARVVEGIYDLDSDGTVWFISRKFSNLRRFFRIFYWASMGLTVLLIALVLTFPMWPGFVGVAFPALATMVIGEIYFAFDGVTKREYQSLISGDHDASDRLTNYGPMREVLAETFPDRILSDGVHLTSRASLSSGFALSELLRSPLETERLAGAYFSRLRQARIDVDVNLVRSSLDLMHDRSVLINTPFYLDLTPYTAIAAYYHLLQSNKVLIVSGRDSLSRDLIAWIERGLEEITGVPDLWSVDQLTHEAPHGLHVGVLAFADVHDLDLLKRNADFLEQVSLIILAEPSRMLATGQLGLSLLLSRCGVSGKPTFVAFDGNHDGLVDSLSHLLKASFTEVVATTLPQGSSAEAIWTSDGPNMHTTVLPRVSRYLGLGTEIGAVALKFQVRHFHWVGGDAFPVLDMKWIAEQYYAQINGFADIELSQDALEEAFVAVANPWDVPQADNYFLIVEDETANAFETIRRYATRARQSGFVNLISPNYLLRDYMIDNRELFASDPKAIPSIVPDYARTERNLVLRLILLMSWSPVSLSNIIREFELIGHSVPVAVAVESHDSSAEALPPAVILLRNLIAQHTSAGSVRIRQLPRFELASRGLEGDAFFELDDSPTLATVMKSLAPAYVYVEDEQGGRNRIGSLLFDHVYQVLMPGQFATFAGKYYEVQSIRDDDARSGVILRRAADHIRDRRVYRPWRDFTLTEIVDQAGAGARLTKSGVEVRRLSGTITVESQGYYERRSDSSDPRPQAVFVAGLPRRIHQNKILLEFRLHEAPAAVRKTVALLLNEMFVTLFPHSHAYVVALTPDNGAFGSLLSDIGGEVREDCIYVVEDSMVDLGLITTIERNWDRLMEMISDYLQWQITPEPEPEPEPAAGGDMPPFIPHFPDIPIHVEPKSWMRRILERLRRPFTRREGAEAAVVPEQASNPEVDESRAIDSVLVEVPLQREAVADLETTADESFEGRQDVVTEVAKSDEVVGHSTTALAIDTPENRLDSPVVGQESPEGVAEQDEDGRQHA